MTATDHLEAMEHSLDSRGHTAGLRHQQGSIVLQKPSNRPRSGAYRTGPTASQKRAEGAYGSGMLRQLAMETLPALDGTDRARRKLHVAAAVRDQGRPSTVPNYPGSSATHGR
jgi:hypothetical protein